MRYLYAPLLSSPLLLVLAACQSAVPFETVSDPCRSLTYLSMVGTKEDAIRPDTFPADTRIVHPDTQVTQDYRAERLNVHINQKGRIERIDCG